MIRAPISRVETPQDEPRHNPVRLPGGELHVKGLGKILALIVRGADWSAFPSCIMASMLRVSTARQSVRWPFWRPGLPKSHEIPGKKSHIPDHFDGFFIASSAVAWAVWPSCHRNSVVRWNRRVRISQRTTLAHWFTSREGLCRMNPFL